MPPWPSGVVWAPHGYFCCSKQCFIFAEPPPIPPLHPTPLLCWPEISTHQKNRLKSPEIQPSAINKVNSTKSNGLATAANT